MWAPLRWVLGITVLTLAGHAAAQQTPTDPLLDGIAVLISASSGNDSSAMLVLASDVELMVRVLRLSEEGESAIDRPIDSAMRFKARRVTALIRLLAQSAQLVGERVEPAATTALMTRLQERAQGKDSLLRMLNECGATFTDLEYWLTNILLAQRQIRYLQDQILMPTRTELKAQYAKGLHPFGDLPFEEAATAFEADIRQQKLKQELARWLEGVLVHGKVIFAQ